MSTRQTFRVEYLDGDAIEVRVIPYDMLALEREGKKYGDVERGLRLIHLAVSRQDPGARSDDFDFWMTQVASAESAGDDEPDPTRKAG